MRLIIGGRVRLTASKQPKEPKMPRSKQLARRKRERKEGRERTREEEEHCRSKGQIKSNARQWARTVQPVPGRYSRYSPLLARCS